MPRETYLIWSNEHRAWWKAGRMGYSPGLDQAGFYTRKEAIEICQDALMTAAQVGAIAEVPVRLTDLSEVLQGRRIIPAVLFTGKVNQP